MKLKSTTIENLRSLENSEFNFEEYNAIVGPNNSGKTSLLRILKMPVSSEFLNLGITQEIKLDQGKKIAGKTHCWDCRSGNQDDFTGANV